MALFMASLTLMASRPSGKWSGSTKREVGSTSVPTAE